MKNCLTCGSNNNDEAMFCDECGEQLPDNDSALALGSTIDSTSPTPDVPADNDQSADMPDAATENSIDDVVEDQDEAAADEAGDDVDAGPVLQTMYLPGDKQIEIREGDNHLISRSNNGHPNATVMIDDQGISSAGIRVEGRDGKVYITDLGSGTVVVGNIIPTNTEAEVHENGVLYAGNTNIFFG